MIQGDILNKLELISFEIKDQVEKNFGELLADKHFELVTFTCAIANRVIYTSQFEKDSAVLKEKLIDFVREKYLERYPEQVNNSRLIKVYLDNRPKYFARDVNSAFFNTPNFSYTYYHFYDRGFSVGPDLRHLGDTDSFSHYVTNTKFDQFMYSLTHKFYQNLNSYLADHVPSIRKIT